jgi:5'-AMP-activated protein kinase catalytic alpha subunit
MSTRPRSTGANNRGAPRTKAATNSFNRSAVPRSGEEADRRQIVGQYMIGKTIGEGTFGKVKLAAHMPTGEKVAVKILEKSRIKEAADIRRVNREIKILKKARHNNIIQLYEVLDTQNAIYLIMECAEGGEMFDYIVQQKRVAEVQACKFFHQIVDGVDELHKNEITHRDLKPENLLLKASPDGWIIKVVDFGLSNTHEGNKLLATACGSPCYAAPEMIAGKKYCGPLADIWSMGVILFALVCGYLPFEDPNTAALYKKILAADYKAPKFISAEVRDLISKILETDPKKRYTMNDIRQHPWYTQVADSAIPKERVDVYNDESTRNETLAVLAAAGIDTQTLLDGLASNVCNSLTATYYLFEQKHRNAQQVADKNQRPARHNSSDLTQQSQRSNPATNHDRGTTQTNTAMPALIGAVNNLHIGTAGSSAPPAPLENASNNPSPRSTAHKQSPSNLNGVTGAPTVVMDMKPYLQAPLLVIQQQQQQQVSNRTTPRSAAAMAVVAANNAPVNNDNNNGPSLDAYMRQGAAFPQQQQQQQPLLQPINGTGVQPKAGSSVAPGRALLVPPLQFDVNTSVNNNNAAMLQSQTARVNQQQPLGGMPMVKIQGSNANTGAVTARPAGPTDPVLDLATMQLASQQQGQAVGVEGEDRPSTRRSRTRGTAQQQVVLEGDDAMAMDPVLQQRLIDIPIIVEASLTVPKVISPVVPLSPVRTGSMVPQEPTKLAPSANNGGRKGRNLVTKTNTDSITITTGSSAKEEALRNKSLQQGQQVSFM